MSEAEEIVRAGAEAALWAEAILKKGREQWLMGDKWFLARQAEMHLMRAQECRCPENTCAGCVLTIAVGNILETHVAKLQGAGSEEEFAEREKARSVWKELRQNEARRFGEIVRRIEDKTRQRSVPQHWADGK